MAHNGGVQPTTETSAYSHNVQKYDMHISAGSVLLQDEANSSSDVAINMDALERDRYQQQMQLIEQDVSHGLWLNIL